MLTTIVHHNRHQNQNEIYLPSVCKHTRNLLWRYTFGQKLTFAASGVFHQVIKYKNLLVNQDTMEVKLIDFGCGALMKNSGFKVFIGMCCELLY